MPQAKGRHSTTEPPSHPYYIQYSWWDLRKNCLISVAPNCYLVSSSPMTLTSFLLLHSINMWLKVPTKISSLYQRGTGRANYITNTRKNITSTLSIFINSFSMVLAPTHSGYFRPPSTGSMEPTRYGYRLKQVKSKFSLLGQLFWICSVISCLCPIQPF